MARFCGNCGTALADNAAFCGGCGKPAAPPAPASYAPPQQSFTPPPPVAPSYTPPAPPATPSYAPPQQSYAPPAAPSYQPPQQPPQQSYGGAAAAPAYQAPQPPQPPPQAPSWQAPPQQPPQQPGYQQGGYQQQGYQQSYQQQGYQQQSYQQSANPYGAPASGGLPASPAIWDMQKSLIPTGENLAASLGANPTGFMKTLAWIIRSTFLDPRVARQAALDENGTGDAILAMVLTALPKFLLGWIFVGAFGFWLRSTLIIGVVSAVVMYGLMIFVMSALSQPILGTKLSPGQLIRGVAYSTGANVFGFIPVLGALLSLWSVVTAVAAVREISGADTGKVIIFGLVGGLIGAVAAGIVAMVLGSILIGGAAMGRFGGF